LISSWWCSFLFMAEVFALYYYFSTYWRRDRWGLKGTVIFAFLVDTLGIIFQLMQVYFYILYNWTGETVMATIAAGLAQGTNAFIVQTLLAWRFWTLSRNAFVSIFLFLVALASFIGIWGLSMREVFHDKESDTPSYRPYFIVWLSCSVAADVLIACSLVFLLTRMNSSFKPTRNLIQRIIMLTIGTGSITAVIALTMLLDYLFVPNSNYTAIGMPLGRLYTLNVFVLLLSRNNMQNSSSAGYTVSASGTGANVSLNVINVNKNTGQMLPSGIKTTQTIETMQFQDMDDDRIGYKSDLP